MSNVAPASLLIKSLFERAHHELLAPAISSLVTRSGPASRLVLHLNLLVAFPLCNRSNQQENLVHTDPYGRNTGRCRVKRRTNC